MFKIIFFTGSVFRALVRRTDKGIVLTLAVETQLGDLVEKNIPSPVGMTRRLSCEIQFMGHPAG